MHYFFVKNINNKIIFSNQDAHHIIKVLRNKLGSFINCVDQNNFLITSKIISTNPLIVEIINMKSAEDLPTSNINLYIGVIKKPNFDLLIRCLNEMNVKSITPVFFARSQKNIIYDYKRIETIIYESCKQSNRIIPIIINETMTYQAFLKYINDKQNYFAYEKEKINFFSKLNCRIKEDINLIIGPEGGFTVDEIVDISKISYSISLGPNILRSETAAIYMSSIFLEKEKFNEKQNI